VRSGIGCAPGGIAERRYQTDELEPAGSRVPREHADLAGVLERDVDDAAGGVEREVTGTGTERRRRPCQPARAPRSPRRSGRPRRSRSRDTARARDGLSGEQTIACGFCPVRWLETAPPVAPARKTPTRCRRCSWRRARTHRCDRTPRTRDRCRRTRSARPGSVRDPNG